MLVETARRHHAVIAYSELAEEVQRRSSLHTRSPMRNWIGGLLADLVKVNHVRNEPPLTSLVVHNDAGQVGPGYAEMLRVAGESPIADLLERETHAAAARLECYRHDVLHGDAALRGASTATEVALRGSAARWAKVLARGRLDPEIWDASRTGRH